ncbi:hypothetical protein JCM10207_001285 [Rhodosporidiobolus poonsookiae]
MLSASLAFLTLSAAASAFPAIALNKRDDLVYAGQLFPESCLSVCQPFVDANKACYETGSCCTDDYEKLLLSCAPCVESAQGYDSSVASGMQSIVRVYNNTCHPTPTSSVNPTHILGGTTYVYEAEGPTLYWFEPSSAVGQTNAYNDPALRSSVLAAPGPSSTASTSTSGPASSATAPASSSTGPARQDDTSSSATVASQSGAPAATQSGSNGASRLGGSAAAAAVAVLAVVVLR